MVLAYVNASDSPDPGGREYPLETRGEADASN